MSGMIVHGLVVTVRVHGVPAGFCWQWHLLWPCSASALEPRAISPALRGADSRRRSGWPGAPGPGEAKWMRRIARCLQTESA